jgi:hypothetical protein
LAGRPFRLGEQDCGLMLADWCLSELGVDPARLMRGQYETVDEAKALLGVSSLPMVFGRLCRHAGIPMTTRPQYGDICMIKLGGSVRGAIKTSGYVVLSQGAGISRVRDARLVAAWSVHA